LHSVLEKTYMQFCMAGCGPVAPHKFRQWIAKILVGGGLPLHHLILLLLVGGVAPVLLRTSMHSAGRLCTESAGHVREWEEEEEEDEREEDGEDEKGRCSEIPLG